MAIIAFDLFSYTKIWMDGRKRRSTGNIARDCILTMVCPYHNLFQKMKCIAFSGIWDLNGSLNTNQKRVNWIVVNNNDSQTSHNSLHPKKDNKISKYFEVSKKRKEIWDTYIFLFTSSDNRSLHHFPLTQTSLNCYNIFFAFQIFWIYF